MNLPFFISKERNVYMSIYEALNNLTNWKKKEYFLWKFELNMYANGKTEEQICKKLQMKTLAPMLKWEKSPEYLHLVNILIESKTAKDLEDIYIIVREKALEGDEKNIKLLMDIQKQARQFNREVQATIIPVKEEQEETSSPIDELEL